MIIKKKTRQNLHNAEQHKTPEPQENQQLYYTRTERCSNAHVNIKI